MPNGPLILAVDLRNTPECSGYGRTHGPTHCFIYIDGGDYKQKTLCPVLSVAMYLLYSNVYFAIVINSIVIR